MNLKTSIKLVSLLTALTATVVAIYWLKSGHMNSFWTSLGFKTGERINWCQERVESIYFYDQQAKLLEKDGKWFWQQDDKERELDYLRVEKWFAQYCQVNISAPESQEPKPAQPIFEAKFMDGERITLKASSNPTLFSIGVNTFNSETLRQGLKELLAFGKKIE